MNLLYIFVVVRIFLSLLVNDFTHLVWKGDLLYILKFSFSYIKFIFIKMTKKINMKNILFRIIIIHNVYRLIFIKFHILFYDFLYFPTPTSIFLGFDVQRIGRCYWISFFKRRKCALFSVYVDFYHHAHLNFIVYINP